MKNFKNYINEEKKKKYTREEIINWCKINVLYFDVTVFDRPQISLWSKNHFCVEQSKQTVYYNSDKQLVIKSKDTELLDIKFVCEHYGYDIRCEKLKKLNINNFFLNSDICFTRTNNLDFSDIVLHSSVVAYFTECNKLVPNDIKNIHTCVFRCSKNSKITDFNNYNNSSIKDITINPYFKYKNTTNMIASNDFHMVYTSLHQNCDVYTGDEIDRLNNIFNIFLSKKSSKEYVMDFTVRMIDEGFEDEV